MMGYEVWQFLLYIINKVDKALDALKNCAQTGDGNLLELAMQVRELGVVCFI